MALWRRIGSSELIRHFLILASGTAAAAAIPLLFWPLFSRLYTPADFGLFASFVAAAGILEAVTSLRLAQVIMIPRSDAEAAEVFYAAEATSMVLSACALPLLVGARAMGWLQSGWFFWLPVSMFTIAGTQGLSVWLNRRKTYRPIAIARVSQSVVLVVVTAVVGLLAPPWKEGGLILGWVAGGIAGFLVLALRNRHTIPALPSTGLRERILPTIRRYRDISLHGTPAVFISACATQALVLLAAFFHGTQSAGYVSFLEKFSAVYMVVVGRNLADLLYRRVSESTFTQAYPLLKRTLGYLTALMVAGHFALAVFIWFQLVPVFGEQWEPAREVGLILIPLWCIWAVFAPLQHLYNYYRAQQLNLVWQCGWLVTDVAVFLVGRHLGWTFIEVVTVYSVKQFTLFLAGILMMLGIARARAREPSA